MWFGIDGCCTVCVCQVLAVTIVCSATSSHVRMVAGAQTLTTAQCAPVRRYVVDCFHIGSGRFVNSLDFHLVLLKSTLPTLKAFLNGHNQNVWQQAWTCYAVGCQKMHFPMNSWSSSELKKCARRLFSISHHLPLVFFANATELAFVLLHNSRFNSTVTHIVNQHIL